MSLADLGSLQPGIYTFHNAAYLQSRMHVAFGDTDMVAEQLEAEFDLCFDSKTKQWALQDSTTSSADSESEASGTLMQSPKPYRFVIKPGKPGYYL
ncbi:hypothetical protein CVT26_002662 [Gymnopilus dilepis]|uniref:Uncharacterized protein n=1 Tax=Gymnopilus dilepis TaxID=231916 RepID=A0A409VF07_9AGAR|nr:hypothetical protein CVT26_002662 [Gymnopilus dilepis]